MKKGRHRKVKMGQEGVWEEILLEDFSFVVCLFVTKTLFHGPMYKQTVSFSRRSIGVKMKTLDERVGWPCLWLDGWPHLAAWDSNRHVCWHPEVLDLPLTVTWLPWLLLCTTTLFLILMILQWCLWWNAAFWRKYCKEKLWKRKIKLERLLLTLWSMCQLFFLFALKESGKPQWETELLAREVKIEAGLEV